MLIIEQPEFNIVIILISQVEHLDTLIKLKDERIEELQKQLDRKQARRKEVEAYQNSLAVPFETVQSPAVADVLPVSRKSSLKTIECSTKVAKHEESKIPVPKQESAVTKSLSKPSITEVSSADIITPANNVERIKSDVFKEVEIVDLVENHVIIETPQFVKPDDNDDADSVDDDQQCEEAFKDKVPDGFQDVEEFKDSEQDVIITIEETIQKEISDIIKPTTTESDLNYII